MNATETSPPQNTRCRHCGQISELAANYCDNCGMALSPAPQPEQTESHDARNKILLSRTLTYQDFERLQNTFRLVRSCNFFPGYVVWPEDPREDRSIWQILPEGTTLLFRGGATAESPHPFSRKWLAWLTELAELIDTVHRQGCRLNSFGIHSIIVQENTYDFTGLCLPISLSYLDTPRTEMTQAGIDCCFASPEVQGYVDYPVSSTADVYTLAALTYYLLTGEAPRDLMECNFCPIRDHPDLGPSLRECLEDALAIIPERRPRSAGQFVERIRKALVKDLSRPGPEVRWAHITDIGIGGRNNNEDACGVWMRSAADAYGRCLFGVAAVADGMGGGAFGERASSLCIDRILEDTGCDLRILGGALATHADWVTVCRDWLLRLNQEVIELGRKLSAPNDIGSTLTAVVFVGHRAILLHAGDSHLYLLRSGSISRLTRSQTYAEQLFEEGQLTREEIETSIYRNVLTSFIGSPKCEPQVEELNLMPGDTLVLCTDGLMEGVSERDIQHLAARLPPNEAVAEMVRRCKHRLQTVLSDPEGPAGIPCSDNMTAVVVQILGEPMGERIPGVAEDGALPSEEPAVATLDSTPEMQLPEGDTHA